MGTTTHTAPEMAGVARPVHAAEALALGRLVDHLRQAVAGEEGAVKLLLDVAGYGEAQVVSTSVIRLLCDLLEDLSEGRVVTIAPYGLPVGTETAANALGVSRPWLTKLIDRGDLPGERVGSKRRVQLGDLVAFRRSDDARRRAAASDWSFLDEPAD